MGFSIRYCTLYIYFHNNINKQIRDLRDVDSIPGSGISPGRGHGNPLQYSCQENPMDRGAWWIPDHKVAKSQTWLKWLNTQAHKLRRRLQTIFYGQGTKTSVNKMDAHIWTVIKLHIQDLKSRVLALKLIFFCDRISHIHFLIMNLVGICQLQ